MVDILCAGQLVADILVRPVDRVDFGTDTQRVQTIDLANGGDALNAAIGLARLGARVAFAGKVGRDHWGDFLSGVIDRAGIDHRGLTRTDQAGTAAVIVLINGEGDRTFLYRGGANDLFSIDDIDPRIVDEALFVHVGGTFLLPRFDGRGAAALFQRAQAAGKTTSMDVTWDTSGRWLPVIAECLPHLSWFLPSVNEARRITGRQSPEDMARFLRERGVQNVVIKLGAEGCYVLPKGAEGFVVEAFPVQPVDTTGAGDAFVAGFLTGLLRGWDARGSARLGCAVAALNIRAVGATAGIPTFDEAMHFMERGAV